MEPQRPISRKHIWKYSTQAPPKKERDAVTTEEPLEIWVLTGPMSQPSARHLLTTMRTPGSDYALAAGLLYAEGMIEKAQDIVKMRWKTEPEHPLYNVLEVRLAPDIEPNWSQFQRFQTSVSSCGLCGRQNIAALKTNLTPQWQTSWQVTSSVIYTLNQQLKEAQPAFKRTGGIHAAALFDRQGHLLGLEEDIGRHNAVDKLVGRALLEDRLPLNQCVLLSSGRSSFEVIQKSLRAHIPVVVAIGAPSSLAVELSEAYGQTLIGFLRHDRFNAYSGIERIST